VSAGPRQTWQVGKQAVRSSSGVVAAQSGLAAEAGAGVLAQGGNAIDAAVTTALVLSVVEPWLSGLGGGGFLVAVEPDGTDHVLDFNVRAPARLDPTRYRLVAGTDGDWFDWPAVEGDLNVSGYQSICVPGAVAGLAEALDKLGTISFAEALGPAIAEAERGLVVDWYCALAIAMDAAALARFPASAALFLDDGRGPRVPDRGTLVRPMERMARLLRQLAHAGAHDFYEGETAAALVRDLSDGGSVVSADDLAAYRPHWRRPLRAAYRGRAVYAVPGLSGGPSLIEALTEVEKTFGPCDDVAGAQLAYAQAIRNAYGTRLAKLGHAAAADDCTSHVSVIDRNGMAASLTNTLLSRFGSKVVLPDSGIVMNNGMMWFDPRPGRPNAIAAGAQPLANMSPIVVAAENGERLAIGAAGGRKIFPAILQVLSRVVDFGDGLEAALHAPRIDASEPTILVDARFPPEVARRLSALYPTEVVEDTLYPVHFAVPSAVLRTATGTIEGMGHPNSPWAAAVAAGSA
jgi:gamma-glutamyltranspeptidase/glutathione hydrolase